MESALTKWISLFMNNYSNVLCKIFGITENYRKLSEYLEMKNTWFLFQYTLDLRTAELQLFNLFVDNYKPILETNTPTLSGFTTCFCF